MLPARLTCIGTLSGPFDSHPVPARTRDAGRWMLVRSCRTNSRSPHSCVSRCSSTSSPPLRPFRRASIDGSLAKPLDRAPVSQIAYRRHSQPCSQRCPVPHPWRKNLRQSSGATSPDRGGRFPEDRGREISGYRREVVADWPSLSPLRGASVGRGDAHFAWRSGSRTLRALNRSASGVVAFRFQPPIRGVRL